MPSDAATVTAIPAGRGVTGSLWQASRAVFWWRSRFNVRLSTAWSTSSGSRINRHDRHRPSMARGPPSGYSAGMSSQEADAALIEHPDDGHDLTGAARPPTEERSPGPVGRKVRAGNAPWHHFCVFGLLISRVTASEGISDRPLPPLSSLTNAVRNDADGRDHRQ
jgi:hypothetical protein